MEESMSQHNCQDRRGPKGRSSSNGVVEHEDNRSGEFDCNICLDSVHEPVVTRCGHLYCWPCLYKWIHFVKQEDDDGLGNPSCPVCKAEVLQETLVPLFGRGKTRSWASDQIMVVPKRPIPGGVSWLRPTHPRRTNTYRLPRLGQDPILGMVGVFGTSTSNLLIYPTSYHATASTPPARRQVLQMERSMSRIFFFLCCCAAFLFLFY